MKKLQNNFTTPEQSKRLLQLGVPEDSADCYYQDYGSIPMIVWTETQPRNLKKGILKPCWSVGRLIEIYNICVNLIPGMQLDLDNEPESCTYIELIISSFELAKDDGLIDFSKLEE